MKEIKRDSGTTPPLSGKNNERIDDTLADCSEITAAWADIDHVEGAGKIPVPSENAIEEAKDWVDNQNQL